MNVVFIQGSLKHQNLTNGQRPENTILVLADLSSTRSKGLGEYDPLEESITTIYPFLFTIS
jgi:hypothetical protein